MWREGGGANGSPMRRGSISLLSTILCVHREAGWRHTRSAGDRLEHPAASLAVTLSVNSLTKVCLEDVGNEYRYTHPVSYDFRPPTPTGHDFGKSPPSPSDSAVNLFL